jgi:hypothetical protein
MAYNSVSFVEEHSQLLLKFSAVQLAKQHRMDVEYLGFLYIRGAGLCYLTANHLWLWMVEPV